MPNLVDVFLASSWPLLFVTVDTKDMKRACGYIVFDTLDLGGHMNALILIGLHLANNFFPFF